MSKKMYWNHKEIETVEMVENCGLDKGAEETREEENWRWASSISTYQILESLFPYLLGKRCKVGGLIQPTATKN